MKSKAIHAATPNRTCLHPLMLTASVFIIFQSCIYDAPGDEFYRTLWVSEVLDTTDALTVAEDIATFTSNGSHSDAVDTPALPGLILEFLCDGNICIQSTGAAGSYGTYDSHGSTARFQDLHLTFFHKGDEITIIVEEAHRRGDLLTINWHFSDSSESYITNLVRKSSY